MISPLVCWPFAACIPMSVTVTYLAGYPTSGESPDTLLAPPGIKQAVLVMVRDLYDNRADAVIGASVAKLNIVDNLLRPFRVEVW